MTDRKPTQDDVTRLFRDVVLVLGGVFAVDGTDDRTIRRVATGLERAYQRARQQPQPPKLGPRLTPHPAIAALLQLTEHEGAQP